jgi:hypothetical protein
VELTISFDEPLASRLRERASARSVSPEDAVRDIVGAALQLDENEEAWARANQRRVELIDKGIYGALSAAEREELDRLQAAAIARVAPLDRQLLAVAEEFRRLAEALPDAPKS